MGCYNTPEILRVGASQVVLYLSKKSKFANEKFDYNLFLCNQLSKKISL